MIVLVKSEPLCITPIVSFIPRYYCFRPVGLQEVFSSSTTSSRNSTSMVRYGTEDLEFLLEILTQVHDGSNVTATVTVVGCRPNSNDILVFEMILQTG